MSSEEDRRGVARTKALDLLARREHSQGELRTKLHARGFAAAEVEAVITNLASAGLQSDSRFLESFVEGHARRGQGPLKIAAELRVRGVTGEAVEAALEPHAQRWYDLARMVRERRFGASLPADARERAAQVRFLTQRGFNSEQVRAAFAPSPQN
jgi:regulatory protein